MSPSAIIFDCDGVLVDSEIIYCAVELEHLSAVGLHYERSAYQARFTGLPGKSYEREVAKDYAKLGKGDVPANFHKDMMAACKSRFETELVAVSGASAFLEGLDLPVAVASSSGLDRLHWKLEKTGLHDYFSPNIYSGDQVKRGKPEPDLFLFAAEKLAVKPSDCVVIEDSSNGVRAGVAAGMTVLGFLGGSHIDEGFKDRLLEVGAADVCSSFREIALKLKPR